MLKYFQSGWVLIILTILCLAAGLLIPHATLFIYIGAFFLVASIIVRARFSGRTPPPNQ